MLKDLGKHLSKARQQRNDSLEAVAGPAKISAAYLHKLENVMERARFQLESTITAMGTVYSQMMILNSRDVASGRADRLQQDVADQVQALQDIVHTMYEVYQAGTDPLGLGLAAPAPGTAARQALGTTGQTGRKSTGN